MHRPSRTGQPAADDGDVSGELTGEAADGRGDANVESGRSRVEFRSVFASASSRELQKPCTFHSNPGQIAAGHKHGHAPARFWIILEQRSEPIIAIITTIRRRLWIVGLAIAILLAIGAAAAVVWAGRSCEAACRRSAGELDSKGSCASHGHARRAGHPDDQGRLPSDVARATGFLHAQDRFFQMDLPRRRAVGRTVRARRARAFMRP